MNKALIFISLFLFTGLASASFLGSLHESWETWKMAHQKSYSESENRARFGIFVENYKIVKALNAQSKGITKFGLNKFADLTSAEFGALYTVSDIEAPGDFVAENLIEKKITDLPDAIDWREKGAVNRVKDQGSCGSCWAFSATGLLEGTYFVNNGKLLSFSEQQIVDCAYNAGYGCQGGWPYLAVQYAAESGLELESDYPYKGVDGTCRFESSKAIKVTSGYKFVQPKSTDSLKTALVDGPVSVLVQADQSAFQFYTSGVLTTGCGSSLNHAVLAVGYQKVSLLEAFIVKNSWGSSWGDKGYIMISTIQQINQGQGVCGILAQPVVALA